jgi:Mrp family chromosome partitioning ATPase
MGLPAGSRWREPQPVHAASGPIAGAAQAREWSRAAIAGPGIIGAKTPLRTITSAQVSDKVIMARNGTMDWERKHYFSIERYRLLSTRVMRVAHNMRTQVFLMASAIAEEGKTLTSANLAYAMSSAEGKRILLLELDLRRPSLRTLLGAQADPDEALFLEADDWRRQLWELRPNLHALMAMRGAERPDEILHGEAVRRLIDEARREYDYVLIDSAPLLLAVDTHVLLPHADHALLVVRADATPIACTRDALKALGDKALGCILNDVKRLKYEEYYRSYYR